MNTTINGSFLSSGSVNTVNGVFQGGGGSGPPGSGTYQTFVFSRASAGATAPLYYNNVQTTQGGVGSYVIMPRAGRVVGFQGYQVLTVLPGENPPLEYILAWSGRLDGGFSKTENHYEIPTNKSGAAHKSLTGYADLPEGGINPVPFAQRAGLAVRRDALLFMNTVTNIHISVLVQYD